MTSQTRTRSVIYCPPPPSLLWDLSLSLLSEYRELGLLHPRPNHLREGEAFAVLGLHDGPAVGDVAAVVLHVVVGEVGCVPRSDSSVPGIAMRHRNVQPHVSINAVACNRPPRRH